MTAVEWLEEQYTKQITFLHREDFEQAKELEKQQIMDAWNDGRYENTGYGDSETHYNETFNK